MFQEEIERGVPTTRQQTPARENGISEYRMNWIYDPIGLLSFRAKVSEILMDRIIECLYFVSLPVQEVNQVVMRIGSDTVMVFHHDPPDNLQNFRRRFHENFELGAFAIQFKEVAGSRTRFKESFRKGTRINFDLALRFCDGSVAALNLQRFSARQIK
jgi:hypothetical protein